MRDWSGALEQTQELEWALEQFQGIERILEQTLELEWTVEQI